MKPQLSKLVLVSIALAALSAYSAETSKLVPAGYASEFELIGYDKTTDAHRDTRQETSLNFPAKKKLQKTCTNAVFKGDCEFGCKPQCKYKEKWSTLTLKEPILLKNISSIKEVEGY